MAPSRWDLLLDQKPIPLLEHLVQEVSKLLSKDLERWPPPIQELDPVAGAKFRPLFEEGAPAPRREVYEEAFKLARLEVEREVQAIDEYIRNRRWLERGLQLSDKTALLFLCQWLVEQLLGLKESTQGRVKRPQMLDILDRTERRLREAWSRLA